MPEFNVQYVALGFFALLIIGAVVAIISLLLPQKEKSPKPKNSQPKSNSSSLAAGHTVKPGRGTRRLRLTWVDKKGKDRSELLSEEQVSRSGGVVIGREGGNGVDIKIEFESVSRRHLQLRVDNGELLLIDLESTNGTTINSHSLTPGQPVSVQPGDIIQLAREVTMKVELV